MYWLSRRTRNDIVMLYGFADHGVPSADLRALVESRSARMPDLRLRLREVPGDLDYPRWTPCRFAADQFVEHRPARSEWGQLLEALGEILGTAVVATVRPWRVHVFRGIENAPMRNGSELTTVVVVQISHALADGQGALAIVRALFATSALDEVGTPVAVPNIPTERVFRAPLEAAIGVLGMPIRMVRTFVRGLRVQRARQELAALTDAGLLPGPGASYPPTVLNHSAGESITGHDVRMIFVDAADLRIPGRTVMVAVLTAVSVALVEYLTARGESVDRLGAEVPMALPTSGSVRNNYRGLGVDLHIDESDLSRRADRIAADLVARKLRATHPLLGAQDRVTSVIPSVLLRRDIEGYPLGTPEHIAGHTVVSSVRHGPADLAFGGPVRFAGVFPAVGSVMHLTHGVHGIGDTVTVCVHADPAVLPDIDTYTGLLRAALHRVSRLDPAPGG